MGNSGMIAGAFSSTSGLADTVLTTDGDILYYNNSGRQRLPKGDNDEILQLKSGLPSWETVSAGATTAIQRVVLGSTFNTGSTSFVDATGMTVTLPNNTGHSFISFQICCDMNGGTGSMAFRLVDDTTNLAGITLGIATAAIAHIVVYPYVASNDGQAVKLQVKCSANNIDINAGAELSSEISVLNVS